MRDSRGGFAYKYITECNTMVYHEYIFGGYIESLSPPDVSEYLTNDVGFRIFALDEVILCMESRA